MHVTINELITTIYVSFRCLTMYERLRISYCAAVQVLLLYYIVQYVKKGRKFIILNTITIKQRFCAHSPDFLSH